MISDVMCTMHYSEVIQISDLCCDLSTALMPQQ